MIAGNYVYTVRCQMCGEEHDVIAGRQDIETWLSGEKYIQDALYYLSASDRELLISGTCDRCWKILYPNDEEPEDD